MKQGNTSVIRMLRPGDFLCLLLILALSLTLFLLPRLKKAGETLIVTLADGSSFSLPLARDSVREIESNGYHLTVKTEKNKAFVSASDCPDGVCRHTAPISRPGETILCVPAGVVLRVSGEKEGGDDVTVGRVKKGEKLHG